MLVDSRQSTVDSAGGRKGRPYESEPVESLPSDDSPGLSFVGAGLVPARE
jgi:hypothetical protein